VDLSFVPSERLRMKQEGPMAVQKKAEEKQKDCCFEVF
jgi:hypothetical protein